jgi:hypothetical protein
MRAEGDEGLALGDGAAGGVGSARRAGRSDGDAGGFEISGRGPLDVSCSTADCGEAILEIEVEGMKEGADTLGKTVSSSSLPSFRA